MTIVTPGRDPLAPLKFMSSAKRIPFTLTLMEGGWQGTRQQLLQVFNERIEGMYDVLLGDESKFRDDEAEFVIYCEHEDEEKVRAILEYLGAR